MSHPLYNPYASGNQNSSQGQYGLPSSQAERVSRRTPSHLGPGSSFRSSGASSVTPNNPMRMLPSLMSQPITYRPEQSRAGMHEDLERSIDMHISRAREEVRALSKVMHQSKDPGTRFPTTERDEFRSSGSGMASYQLSSTPASAGRRHADIQSGSSSLDWSSDYKRDTSGDSKFYSSTVSSDYASRTDGRFNASSKREHDMQPIPGSGDYDCTVTDEHEVSSEFSQPMYTTESAANILLHFGLEKEDLEQLVSYPEDQMTPANLSFILRQIRIQKGQRATTAVQQKPYTEPQPTRTVSGMDRHSLSSSGGPGMHQEERPSAICQPSKVIDYGHTGKYTGGVGDEFRSNSGSRANSDSSGSMLLMDSYDSSRHSRESKQNNLRDVKSSSFGSLREQASSDPTVSSLYSMVRSSHDQTKRMETQPNQTPQTILSSYSVPLKDTDMRGFMGEASKSVPLIEPETHCQSSLNTQPPCTLFRGVHPSRPGLVLIGSNDATMVQSKGQGSTVAEMKNQQQTPKQRKQQRQQQSKQQMQKKRMQQTQQQLVPQTGQATWRPVFPAEKSLHHPLLPDISDTTRAMQRQAFHPGDPRPIIIPPAVSQQIPSLLDFVHMGQQTSSRQPPAKVAAPKSLPALAVMHDYTAASPRVFPHTCSLCSTECTHMKDWLSHQNTTVHLENCKLLRQRYPEWDGELAPGPRAAGNDAKSSAKPSVQTPQRWQQKTSRSHSRSSSPHHYHGSEGRREIHSSRSRSPHSSRYTRRSRSRSHSPQYDRSTSSHYWSRSMSSEGRLSPRRRDDKQPSPKRRDEGWSSQRSREKPSPPWRTDKKVPPMRRPDERRSPMRRPDERRSPMRRPDERRSPMRRPDKGQSSPRRSHERQLSKERSSPQRKKSSSAESLAKKLLETSAVQSLSKQSDLETVVKTLAPALLAELAKMKSSSSSSSSSAAKESTPKPTKAKPSLQKSGASSSTKTKSGATMVKLHGIRHSLSHTEVVASVERFGKTKSVVLFRSRLEAIVYFEKEEDAKKVNSMDSFNVKGKPVTVVKEKETDFKEQKKTPQKKSAVPSVSKSTTTTTTKKVLKPMSNISGARKVTTGKLSTQKSAAKSSVKGPKTESKGLVYKTKNISTQQKAELVKTGKLPAKGPVKKVVVKQKCSQSEASGDSKQKCIPEKSETSVKKSVGELKETTKVDKPKVLASKAKTSAIQKPSPPVNKSSAAGAVAKEKVERTNAKHGSVPSKTTDSKNGSDKEHPKPKESETKSKETMVVPQDTAKVVETTNGTTCKSKHQAKPPKAENTEEAESVELGQTGMAEPIKVGSCAEFNRSTDGRPNHSQPPTTMEETSSKHLPLDQQSKQSEQPKIKMEDAGTPTEAAVEAKLPGGGVETETVQKGLRPDSVGVTKVEEKYNTISPDSGKNCVTTIKSEPETINVEARLPTVKCQTQPPPSELLNNGSQPGSSSATSTDVAMDEDGEKPGVKGEEVSPLTSVSGENIVPLASSPAHILEESFAELPYIDTDIFKALTEAVRQHRLTRGGRSQSEESASKSNTSSGTAVAEDTPQKTSQDDETGDLVSSEADFFDEQNFNMEDFVTVDEVGDDLGDTSPEPQSSTSPSSREKTERQSSSVLPGGKQTSTRSSKDSESPDSSSSSLSKSTKGSSSSNLSSVSPKKPTDSSKPTKSSTKSQTCSRASKATSSSPPMSNEPPSSHVQKTQPSKTKEKITSAATVETFHKDAKSTEGEVAKSDHRVSAEGFAMKPVESSEINPLPQEHGMGLSPGQTLEIDFNINTLKDQKTTNEEEKKDDVDKHTEEDKDRNSENHQILDSLDQTDEQMDDENQQSGPEEGQTLPEESCQVLDSVHDESKVCQQDDSEMKTEVAQISPEESQLVQVDASTVKQMSEEDTILVEDKSDDALGKNNQPTTSESSSATARNKDIQSKSSGPNTSATNTKYEEQDAADTTAEVSKEGKDSTVKVAYEIVDSVEDKQVQDAATTDRTGRRRSARGKTEDKVTINVTESSENSEEAKFKILDSVEDETGADKQTVTTRCAKGKRESTSKKDASNEKTKEEDTPRERRYTLSTESQEQSRERTVSGKDATNDKDGSNDQTPTAQKRKRGRPKKVVKTTEKDKKGDKDTTEKVADEEEVTCQILDSVDDETAGDQPPTGQSEISKNDDHESKNSASLAESAKNEEEEEPMYQIVDSLDDDQEELTAAEVSDTGKNKYSNEVSAKQEVSTDDIPTCGATVVETSNVFTEEEGLYQIADALEKVHNEPSAPDGTKSKEGTAKEITEGNEQTLLTLDEFIEEEEDGKAEQSTHEDKLLDSSNPETLVTLDEAGGDEEETPDEEKTLRPTKRKQDDDTEESIDFVTVDEVGEVEEEDGKEAVTQRTRGRAKKRTRRAPVRKSTTAKKASSKDEREEEKEPAGALTPSSLEESSSLDKDPSTSSGDGRNTEVKVEAESRVNNDAASAQQELQPERPEDQTLEGCVEEASHTAAIKVVSKQRRDPVGPEAKRARSQSPCVAANFKLPAFKPNNPLGQEFMVPKTGSFCNLCQVFCFNESAAKDLHCSSQTHYDNLQKHYQKLQQKQSRGSTQTSQGSVSD